MTRFPITDNLSDINMVYAWFRDQSWNLYEAGNSEEEVAYLKAIEEVARRTGAPNIWMADYILRLEERLNRIESYVFANT